jgi:chaperonin GroEL
MFETPKPTTDILFKEKARKTLFEGIESAARAVISTLGPRGKTVLIQKGDDSPIVTKDGVTVIKSINFKNPVHKLGAQLLREAATHTNEIAGDGTTTSTTLAYSMIKHGMKLLEAGYDSKSLTAGMIEASKAVDTELLKRSKMLTKNSEFKQVATISANGDEEIGAIIADAIAQVGKDGIITVEDAKGMHTTLTLVKGLQFDRGYLSPYFVNNQEKMSVEYADIGVLLVNEKISRLNDIIQVLEYSLRNSVPLLIIAEDIDSDALQGLILNRINAKLKVVAVKAPEFGTARVDFMNDLAALTGGQVFSKETGFVLGEKTNWDYSTLGKLKKVTVDAKKTTLVGPVEKSNVLSSYIETLKQQYNENITLSTEEKLHLQKRIARLSDGVAVINVGGSTEVEMVEKKYRIEDALNATFAASSEGIIPGGGTALARIALNEDIFLKEKSEQGFYGGFSIIKNACFEPLIQILKNSELVPEVIIEKLKLNDDDDVGYSVIDEKLVNMIDSGIIDPVKVTRAALKNATSVAITFLNLDAVICDDREL